MCVCLRRCNCFFFHFGCDLIPACATQKKSINCLAHTCELYVSLYPKLYALCQLYLFTNGLRKASFALHSVFPFAQIAFSEGNKKLLAIVNVKNSCKISLLISFSFCHITWREQTKCQAQREGGGVRVQNYNNKLRQALNITCRKHTQHWSRGNPRLPQGGACAVTQCVSVGYLDTLPPIRLAPPLNRTKRSQDGCQKYEYMMPPWRHQLAHTFAYVRARRRWRAERNVFAVVKVMQHTCVGGSHFAPGSASFVGNPSGCCCS